ncbi:nucleotide exchange factor GrpE [Mycobacterium sp. pR1184]|uniref:nucleotide exchange factor GrpE n=1 Tax=Mycobacterium sp. pR1184 TaxID=3238981 RepID=UPI00351BB92D
MTVTSAPLITSAGFAADIDWLPTLSLLALAALPVPAAGVLIGLLIPRRQRALPAAELTAQRGALVSGCVKVRGLLDDPLAADVLDEALRAAGVSVFDPTGELKDATHHRVDHTVPAPDPTADGLVACTLTPGYLDGDRLLAPAEVIVYKWVRA